MSAKVRLGWIDIIKGICMFLIVLSHSGAPELYVRFYTPIFLTAFFFVSGYTFNVKNSFKTFFVGKIRALLVPMFCFGTFNIVVAYIFKNSNILKRYIGLFLQRSCHSDDFWFLGCLFSMLMIFYIIVKLSKDKTSMIITISVILTALGYLYINFINIKLPWQFENAMVMEIWLALGYIYKRYEKKLDSYVNIRYCIISIIIYIFLVLIYNNNVNIRLEICQNIFMFMMSSFVGIITLVIFSKLIKFNRVLQYIGLNSLIFYALQSKAIKIVSNILTRIGFELTDYLLVIIIAVLACIIIVPCVYIINRFIPFVVGKGYSKKNC